MLSSNQIFIFILVLSLFPIGISSSCYPPCDTCEENNIFNCLTCLPYHYLDTGGKRCRPCHESCKECSFSGNGACLSCFQGYYLNTFPNSKEGECKPCAVENCSTCTKDSQGQTCTKCNEGFYLEDNICLPCNEMCSECKGPNSDQCTICADGYYDPLSSDSEHSCSKCADTCKKCHGPNIEDCDECSDGYYKQGSICQTCDPECRTCSELRKICTSCHEGYFLDGTFCTKCSTGCSKCIGPYQEHCRECFDGYAYNGNGCQNCLYNQNGCSKCIYSASNYYCTECQPGFKRDDNDNDDRDDTFKCVQCEDYFNCLACPEDISKCTECRTNYIANSEGKCEQCQSPCLDCKGSTTQCTSCVDHYYFDKEANACKDCPENCLKCKSNTECTVCANTFYPLNGKCVKCNDICKVCHDGTDACDECANGYYFDENNKCVKCSPHCKECNPERCYSCEDGFYPSGASCSKCHEKCSRCWGASEGQCTSCSDGYFYASNRCLKCNDACQVCEGPGDHQCSVCSAGYFMKEKIALPGGDGSGELYNRCITCELNCKNCTSFTNCYECDDGYRSYIKEGETEPDCEPCRKRGCKKCDAAADKCTECFEGYYESSKDENNFVVCSRCEAGCKNCDKDSCKDCADGFYLNENKCVRCSSPCATCKSEKECLSCVENHLLEGVSCDSYCESPCLTCEGDKYHCTSCIEGYSLSGTGCIECKSNCLACEWDYYGTLSCITCNDGYYLSGGECEKCHTGCAACFSGGPSSCTSCASGYYWSKFNNIDGQQFTGECSSCSGEGHEACLECISNCDDDTMSCEQLPICTLCSDSYYIDDKGQCQQCNPECKTCINSPSYCTSCQSNQYLKNGQCNDCDYSICSECQNEADYCTKCANNKYLYEGNCYSTCFDAGENLGSNYTSKECYKCPILDHCLEYDDTCQCMKCEDGSYIVTDPDTHDEYCLPCQLDKCKKCTGSNKNDCTECIDGYYVYTYPNSGTMECVACKAPCTLCSSETTCTACIDGYFVNSQAQCEQCHSPCSSKCGGSDGKTCYECDDGYYHTDANECKQCDPSCSTCDGDTNNDCKSCNPGFHLVVTTCTKCNPPCITCSETDGSYCLSCGNGYYLSGTTCDKCSSLCRTCEGSADKCTGCKEGFYLTSQSKCESCATGCATCDGAPEKCQTCITGYQLDEGTCKECSTGCAVCEGSITYCTSCIDGYYHRMDNTCQRCESPCETCTGPTNDTCKSCIKRYVLNGSICVLAPDDCEANKHCEKDNTDGKEYIEYEADLPLYDGYSNEESGGAIRLINYGFSGENAEFKDCYSQNGGGGGIYIFNNIENPDATYTINLKHLTFRSCKGYFGGVVYIYSPSEKSPVIIESCNFFSNEIYSTPSSNKISGGSAIYLTVVNGKVNNCRFAGNKGPGGIIRVSKNLNKKPQNLIMLHGVEFENRTSGFLLIKDCTFESEEASGCSLFLELNKLLTKVEVRHCKFTGSLVDGSHFIDGMIINEKHEISVKSCIFASDESRAFNSKLINDNLRNDFLVQNSFSNKNNQSHVRPLLPSLAFAVIATIILAVFKISMKNSEPKSNGNESIEA